MDGDEFTSPTDTALPTIDVDAKRDAVAGDRGGGREHRNPLGWYGSPGVSCVNAEEDDTNTTALIDNSIDLTKRSHSHHNPLVESSEKCGFEGAACDGEYDHIGTPIPVQDFTLTATSTLSGSSVKYTVYTTVVYQTLIQVKNTMDNNLRPQKLAVSTTTAPVTQTVTEIEGSHVLMVAAATGPYVVDSNPHDKNSLNDASLTAASIVKILSVAFAIGIAIF
jgi:hypothetical protein